ESAREIVDQWNPGGDEASHARPSHPGSGRDPEPWIDWPLAPVSAEDSIPGGETVHHGPLGPGTPVQTGPISTSPRGGHSSDNADRDSSFSPFSDQEAEGTSAAADRRPRELRIGDEVAGFHLVLELGRGAFARVFLAEEVNLGRRLVAVKV